MNLPHSKIVFQKKFEAIRFYTIDVMEVCSECSSAVRHSVLRRDDHDS